MLHTLTAQLKVKIVIIISLSVIYTSIFYYFQGNPVGQSGLGMAYLYGRGVQVVKTRFLI